MTNAVFLYVTAPDMTRAREIAGALVERGLAACVNILGSCTAVYRWRGAVEQGEEIAMIVKTTSDAAAAARETILRLHPYDTPAIAALTLDETRSSAAFIDWIKREAAGESGSAT